MDIEGLKLFIEVMRAGSFAAVARLHHVDPSSVSRTIALLESALGFRLFYRTTRRLSATEAGALYFERIQPLVDDLEAIGQEARDLVSQPSGRLRLTASVSFGYKVLVPLLPSFRAAHPDLVIDLILTDSVLDLITEKIDLAVRLGSRIDTDLVGVRLKRTRYLVCACPGYLKTAPRLKVPSDLVKHSCVLFPDQSAPAQWRFRAKNGLLTEVFVDGSITITNALALHRAACDGLGPALLADWLVAEDVKSGRLIEMFPKYDVTETDFDTAVWVLYPSRAYLPRKVRATIDFLRSHIKDG
jgi:DNA-binding transcriptional LysR family regulator